MIRAETYQRLDFTRIREILAEKCATRGGKAKALNLSPSRSPESAKIRFNETGEALEFTASLPFSYCTPGEELLAELENERFLGPRKFLQVARVLEGINLIHKRIASGDAISTESTPDEDEAAAGRFKLLRCNMQLNVFVKIIGAIVTNVIGSGSHHFLSYLQCMLHRFA